MYASQWFLTLFTAKFPLYMVFHIIDLLLCEPQDLQNGRSPEQMQFWNTGLINRVVAVHGLGQHKIKKKSPKNDLLLTDFEGALKFFRVQLPKRYRSEENAKKLMELACNMKLETL
ncbi:Rab GTPase-activating protein 1 [Saguinus oedipus]|uniref:Rab GTPase-activating protein 1 n=1 Tax=Saguinus oedipus TaxID=9490 RepID=A0ABQ9WF72_SAGOE|nr:Rab GTPase-activating protein 1 [Saguinus oedipus]